MIRPTSCRARGARRRRDGPRTGRPRRRRGMKKPRRSSASQPSRGTASSSRNATTSARAATVPATSAGTIPGRSTSATRWRSGSSARHRSRNPRVSSSSNPVDHDHLFRRGGPVANTIQAALEKMVVAIAVTTTEIPDVSPEPVAGGTRRGRRRSRRATTGTIAALLKGATRDAGSVPRLRSATNCVCRFARLTSSRRDDQ